MKLLTQKMFPLRIMIENMRTFYCCSNLAWVALCWSDWRWCQTSRAVNNISWLGQTGQNSTSGRGDKSNLELSCSNFSSLSSSVSLWICLAVAWPVYRPSIILKT